jgi:hypothetical protein
MKLPKNQFGYAFLDNGRTGYFRVPNMIQRESELRQPREWRHRQDECGRAEKRGHQCRFLRIAADRSRVAELAGQLA